MHILHGKSKHNRVLTMQNVHYFGHILPCMSKKYCKLTVEKANHCCTFFIVSQRKKDFLQSRMWKCISARRGSSCSHGKHSIARLQLLTSVNRNYHLFMWQRNRLQNSRNVQKAYNRLLLIRYIVSTADAYSFFYISHQLI